MVSGDHAKFEHGDGNHLVIYQTARSLNMPNNGTNENLKNN
jgi:hypothetical protein